MARPYASAVFDVAKRSGDLDAWSRSLGLLAAAAAEETVRSWLTAPELVATAKAQKLIDICAGEIDDRGRRFVQVLAANKRLPLLGEISAQFDTLRAAQEQQIDVEVTSALALTSAQEEMLMTALQKKFDSAVNMTHSVDERLLGGAVIRAGDTVIDGSVRGKLNKLAESVLRN